MAGYVIEEGKIKINLPEGDFLELLNELDGCVDLLKPFIQLENNTVIFRDQDLKLLIPEEFFKDEIPDFKPTKATVVGAIISLICVTLFSIFMGYIESPNFGFVTFMLLSLLLACSVSMRWSLQEQAYRKKHRKILYAKAKLVSFFYVNVIQDITTQNERLERSSFRYVSEIDDLKGMVRGVHSSLPHDVRDSKLGLTFPDGEEILPKSKKYS